LTSRQLTSTSTRDAQRRPTKCEGHVLPRHCAPGIHGKFSENNLVHWYRESRTLLAILDQGRHLCTYFWENNKCETRCKYHESHITTMANKAITP
jgi:hypothetical protein